MTQPTNNLLQQLGLWLKESTMVKIAMISFLVLVLLIPNSLIISLIDERQQRAEEAVAEVSQKWSDAQTLTGPVLVLPFRKEVTIPAESRGTQAEAKTESRTGEAFFLPHDLSVNSNVSPEALNRGIFDVVVYQSSVAMQGHFERPNLAALDLLPENVLWDKAYLINGLSDLRGIGRNPSVLFNNSACASEPSGSFGEKSIFRKNFVSPVSISPNDSIMRFAISFPLKGSRSLSFYPMGKSTRVNMSGTWKNPKFDGFYLPESRHVADTFSSTWNILHFNRPFPQQWIQAPSGIESSAFGVNLLIPVDQYQKSIRTAKYGILIVMLTFVALLLIELIVKRPVHPFQYTLIGAALIIYYTLLLSFSEHLGFNAAYLISSAAIIVLISSYSLSIFHRVNISILLGSLLTAFYTYIFIITRQQDYALLLGSVALLAIIATLMYVSRKIDWYDPRKSSSPDSPQS